MSPGATLPTKLSYTAQPTKPTTMAMAIALSVRVTRSVAIARHVQDLVVEQCREDQTDHDCDEPRPVALAGPLLLGQRLAQFALETTHAQDPHQVRYRQEQQGREYRDRKPIVDPGRHRTALLAPGALLYPDQPERQMRREGPQPLPRAQPVSIVGTASGRRPFALALDLGDVLGQGLDLGLGHGGQLHGVGEEPHHGHTKRPEQQ